MLYFCKLFNNKHYTDMKRIDQNNILTAQGILRTVNTACGTACGAAKPEEKPAACGTACGAAKPEEKPAACGTACGAAK